MSRGGWIFSALLHVGAIGAAVLGLPQLFESDALDASDRPIAVSLVEIAAVASAPAVEPVPAPDPAPEIVETQESAPAAEPEPEPEVMAAAVPAPVVEPEPVQLPEPVPLPQPVVEPTPEPVPVELPEPVPLPQPVVEPTPEAPAAKPVPEPEAAAPMPLAKPPTRPPSFDSLLNDLAAEEPEPPPAPVSGPREKTAKEESFDDLLASLADADDAAPADPAGHAPLTGPLRRKVTDTIRLKVERNWSVPAGVLDAGELVVTLRIQLSQDGSVRSVRIVDDGGANYRTMAESGRRAVLKASPFDTLTRYGDSYEGWRDIVMTFSPPL